MMRSNRHNSIIKLTFITLLIIIISVYALPMMATAEDFNDGDPYNFIKDVKISNIQLYDDGSLAAFDVSVTAACASYDAFSPGTSAGAISFHTEKFGSMEEDPTGEMKYYLYNGRDDAYRWRDAVCDDEYSESDSYWENYLYKDYTCTQIGSMQTSRPIYDITWTSTEENYPQDCFFVSWGQDENGNAEIINIEVGETEYVTTTSKVYFTKGEIIPSKTQKYYAYLWNQWANKDWEGNPTEPDNGWWNPNGIYPDRHIFTLETTGEGIVLENSIADNMTISGETVVGNILTANITDKDNNDASQYWNNYKWIIDGKVVGTERSYEIKEADAGKKVIFTCEGAGEGRSGLLMETVNVQNVSGGNNGDMDNGVGGKTEADDLLTNPNEEGKSEVDPPVTQNTETTENKDDVPPNTADYAMPMLWLCLMTVGFAGLIACIVLKSKKCSN